MISNPLSGTSLGSYTVGSTVLRWGFFLSLLLASVVTACASRFENSGVLQMSASAKAVALVPMPKRALLRCRAVLLLAPACPTLIPDARWRDRAGWDNMRGRFIFGKEVFELNAGAEHPGRPDEDRPPRLVHLVLLSGEAARTFRFGWPSPDAAVPVRNGLRRRHRRHALAFGRADWGGRAGEVVLAPPFGAGGIVGNHVIFRWQEAGSDYAITLHSWEPFTEAVATLRRVVESAGPRLA